MAQSEYINKQATSEIAPSTVNIRQMQRIGGHTILVGWLQFTSGCSLRGIFYM